MPELPEVQTVVSDLQKITGETITGFWTDWKKSLSPLSAPAFEKRIKDRKILAVRRLSKFIVIDLSSRESILIHLRMTGKLLINKQKTTSNNRQNVKQKLNEGILKAKSYKLEAKPKHLHHIFYLKKLGALELHDLRKFGTIELVATTEVRAENFNLGVDPFDAQFTLATLKKIVAKRPNKPLKHLLLDQNLIAGIGNIYASEILFASKILPDRKGATLSGTELSLLHKNIKKVLTLAIKMRGTSISDYRDSNDKPGSFQKVLKVYKRNGQPCKKCATIIKKSVIGQRSTFYCPKCQK